MKEDKVVEIARKTPPLIILVLLLILSYGYYHSARGELLLVRSQALQIIKMIKSINFKSERPSLNRLNEERIKEIKELAPRPKITFTQEEDNVFYILKWDKIYERELNYLLKYFYENNILIRGLYIKSIYDNNSLFSLEVRAEYGGK